VIQSGADLLHFRLMIVTVEMAMGELAAGRPRRHRCCRHHAPKTARGVIKMVEQVLLVVHGSKLLSNTWKQELKITDQAVYGEILSVPHRLKMTLPYDRIAQVNLVRKILTADLELVNKGGTDNLIVRALSKSEAEKAKALIEERIKFVASTTGASQV
jgi:hypothetical protein